jgi:hypothetical protein
LSWANAAVTVARNSPRKRLPVFFIWELVSGMDYFLLSSNSVTLPPAKRISEM